MDDGEITRLLGHSKWTRRGELVDVQGDVHLSNKRLKALPLKFGRVDGYFYCSYNKLTSLSGAPESVGGGFRCGGNQLTSLSGAPKSVGGDFVCSGSTLLDIDGLPDAQRWWLDDKEGWLNTKPNPREWLLSKV